MRTAFNLLGPLTNPAGATSQVIGAPSVREAALMAETLAQLGTGRAFVVHASDGLDEITTTGPTFNFEVRGSVVARGTLTPADFGIEPVPVGSLRGGDAASNCEIARLVLQGLAGPHRDIVLVNAAAALVAAGSSVDFRAAMSAAAHSIDSGSAWRKVEDLARLSNGSR
jgi:anthranilate phosphoribosyltransferase